MKTLKKPLGLSLGFFAKKEDCHKLLRPLQKRAVEFVCEREASALLFKQRLGKTYITAGVIERLRPQRTLLIVPLNNRDSTWLKKLRELVPHIPRCHTTRKGRKSSVAALQGFTSGVFVTHIEQFCSLAKLLRRREWDLIVVDEAHRAKDRASLFARRLAMMRHSPAKKLILTGTAIEEEPQDLWAQFKFLDDEVFGDSWKDFEGEFMEPLEEFDWKKWGRMKGSMRFKRALMKHRIAQNRRGFDFDKLRDFIARIKDHCWYEELPGAKPAFHRIYVDMFGGQRRAYQQLEKKGVLELDNGVVITPQNKAAKQIKLRQLTSGFIYDEDKNVHWVGKAKLSRLMVLIRKIPRPLPIFCLYVPEIEVLREILPGRVKELYGATPREERPKIQEAFQRGGVDYLICQTRTGGVGIDLYRAKNLIVLSSNYSSIDFDQLINRIRLPDQTEPVNIFLIIVEGTIDDSRTGDVFRKNRRVSEVLSQLRRSENG